jgi:hypothetical protein
VNNDAWVKSVKSTRLLQLLLADMERLIEGHEYDAPDYVTMHEALRELLLRELLK